MSTGGVDSSGIDHGSAGILDNPNELETPKRAGKSAADVDKCYDWSSIFLISMTGQCYHSEYSEQVSNETGEGQSDKNLDSQDSDEHQDVADSEHDFFTSRIAVGFCWVIGFIVSLLCLVEMYSWACKQHKRKSRPVIYVPRHTLAARTKAMSMCCWKGRRQSCAVARFRKAFPKWRWDLGSVRFAWRKRSYMILDGVFLVLMTLQSGSIVCAQEVEEQKQQQLDLLCPSATINAVVLALAIVLTTSYVFGRPIYYSYIICLLRHKYKIHLLRQANLDLTREWMERRCAHVRVAGGGWGDGLLQGTGRGVGAL
eukprot:SAG31_NODE_223_length_19859_cov_14.949899_1_plen_313_part_00